MNCKICQENLVCYLGGLLGEQERLAIEEHLNNCQGCQFEADEIAKLRDNLIVSGKNICENNFLEEKVLRQIYIKKSLSLNRENDSVAGNLRKKFITCLAMASIVATLILTIHLLGGTTAEGNIAWAQVADNILKAKTATFDVVLGNGPVIKNIVAGRYRKQILDNNTECIADYATGKILILNSVKKTAFFVKSGNITNYAMNYFQHLKDKIEILKFSPNTTVVFLGKRNINNKTAEGLHIYNDNTDLKIWTDIETGWPELVIYDKTLGQSTLEMSNFKFNISAEEFNLNMEVPENYTLESSITDLSNTTEQDLIEGLRVWVDVYLDGHFPDKLDGGLLISQAKQFNKKNEELGLTEKERLEASIKISKGLLFIQNLPTDSDWQYTGKRATTDDSGVIIFRYKPQGSDIYRVIYGDLTVEDADLSN